MCIYWLFEGPRRVQDPELFTQRDSDQGWEVLKSVILHLYTSTVFKMFSSETVLRAWHILFTLPSKTPGDCFLPWGNSGLCEHRSFHPIKVRYLLANLHSDFSLKVILRSGENDMERGPWSSFWFRNLVWDRAFSRRSVGVSMHNFSSAWWWVFNNGDAALSQCKPSKGMFLCLGPWYKPHVHPKTNWLNQPIYM